MFHELGVPNVITLMRLAASPVIFPILFYLLLPYNILLINFSLATIFLLFGATDFLDGYFARRWSIVSKLGAHLDPIADKFLIFSALIGLLAAQKIFFYWVVVLIAREFFVMGLRLVALERGIAINVSPAAKVKTFFELIYIAFIVANPDHYLLSIFSGWNQYESALLMVVLMLSVGTAHSYSKQFMRAVFAQKNHQTPPFEG